MKRISSFGFTGLVFAISAFLISAKQSTSKPNNNQTEDNPPNIIFIIADDMGWDAFGNYPGMTGIKAHTPTLDSLSNNGITFLNFWTNPVCSPTRASLLTGKYNFRTGVGGVGAQANIELKNNETVIQKYINDKTHNKYANAVIGKWHLTRQNNNAPEDFGIGYYSGIIRGVVPNYYKWTQTSAGQQQEVNIYTTTQLVNKSIEWIQQQQKPFFLWLAFNAPHVPFHRPPLELISNKELSDSPDSIKANPLPYYLAALEAMDKEIERLILSLTPFQKENTVLVFIGDNGTFDAVIQSPYSKNQSKHSLFQGGINTPLIICGKEVTRKNVLETALVQTQDLFSTFADLAGTETSKYEDGISIKPLFTHKNASKRTFVYSEQFGQNLPNADGYTIRNVNYKLIHLDNGNEMLFKLNEDPFEKNNLLSGSLTKDAKKNLDELRKIKNDLK